MTREGREAAGHGQGDDGEPRFFSERHPRAAGTLADVWVPWIESRDGAGITLRPWQRLVLERALEVDGDGRLCWPVVVCSTARQSGKSWLARAGITARCHFGPGLWGEAQECLHIANALIAARRIQSQAWRWAESRDLDVRRAMGAERIIWPDESHWSLVSSKSVWGSSGSMVYGDEAWDIESEVIENGVVPTMLERISPQLWLSSTANVDATALMVGYRAEGIAGSERVMVAEWSVPPDADVDDPASWRRWAAWWSPQREAFMRAARGRSSFASQYLNQWPGAAGDTVRVWPPGWAGCARASTSVPAGGVGALESTLNRSHYGTAYAVVGRGDVISIWTARHGDLSGAAAWLDGCRPQRVVAGLSLVSDLVVSQPVEGFGVSHTMLATPLLEDLVRRGRVAHDHSDVLAAQTRHAKVIESERGLHLSAKQSRGAVETLKAAMWAVLGTQQPAAVAPAVW